MLAYLTFFSVALLQIVSTVQGEEPKFEVCTVSVSFFSGRTNPQFIVKDNQELTEKMLHAREKGWFRLPEQMPFRLGYRGILVEDKDTKFWGLLVGKESAKLQRELLKSVQLKEDDRVEIDKDIELIHFEEAQTFEVRGKRFAPRYTPGHWNPVEALYKRQRCNNCYNYANIRATDNRAQPGFASGQVYTVDANGWTMADPYTADNVKAAALRDGLLELNPYPAIADPVPGPPDEIFKHLVALVVRPATLRRGGDHHWYRLDNNGKWSHKPGLTRVKQIDNGGQEIRDPRVSNNGAYQFGYFMVSDLNTLNINGGFVCPV